MISRSPLRRPVRTFVTALAVGTITLFAGGTTPASAHDDIEGSSPETRSVIDEAISSVDIDFGEVIGDTTKLFLTYDPGNGEIVDIGGETVLTGDQTARLEFPELEDRGTYFVQYLAPVPLDGHVIAGSISFSFGQPTALDDSDNPDVRTSSPSSREVLEDPIDSAEIQFDLEIEDDMVLSLVYDGGNGVDFDDLPGTTTLTSDRSARLDFDELPRRGTYFITYDGVASATGDEIVGATSFVFGEPSGQQSSSFPWLVFIPAAVAILAVGAWFSLRRARAVGIDVDESADAEFEPA